MNVMRYFLILLIALFSSTVELRAEQAPHGVRVIVIDPGHGGSRYPGATYKGTYEKELNLKVALRLGKLIQTNMPGVKVIYTRKTDVALASNLNDDLQARADIANRANGDLFISIHANAAASAAAVGTETFIMGESSRETSANERALYNNHKDELVDMTNEATAAIVRAYIQNLQYTYGQYSEALARSIQNHYVKAGRRNRGVKRQPLKVLYATDMPCVLTEIGFMSNPTEMAYMKSEKGLDQLANAIFSGVKDYSEYVKGNMLIEEAPADAIDDEIVSAPAPKPVVSNDELKSGFTVQIFASSKSYDLNDSRFKSYKGKARMLKGSGSLKYKYCVGRYSSLSDAKRAQAQIKAEFKDAFIVNFKGDKVVK